MLGYNEFNMAVYSINDLEKLCGIKAHTLRIWEKRYGIINPKRTATNIRYYLDEDLQKVLNIALLNRNGIKISKIAKMTDEEIQASVSTYTEVDGTSDDKMDALIFAMLELNEYKFNKILDHNIAEKGYEATMNEIIYPFMDKLSMMWIAGNIKGVHENFVASVIRRKTIIAIDEFSMSYYENAHLTDCQVLISGYQTVAQNISALDNVTILAGISEVKDYAQNVLSRY